MINFECKCGKKLRAKDEAGGKRVKCPGCGTPTMIPTPAPASIFDSAIDSVPPAPMQPAASFTDDPPASSFPQYTAPAPAFGIPKPSVTEEQPSDDEEPDGESAERLKWAGIIAAASVSGIAIVGIVCSLLWYLFSLISFPQPSVALVGHEAGVFSVSSSENGKVIASASRDRSVRVWNVETGQLQRTFDMQPSCIAMSPDGTRLYSATDKSIKVVDTHSGDTVHELVLEFEKGRPSWPIECIAISADGRRLAAGCDHWLSRFSGGKGIAVWDLSDPSATAPICRALRAAGCLAISPDGRYLAAGVGHSVGRDGGSCGSVALMHTDTLEPVEGFKAICDPTSKRAHENGRTSSIAFSPDGKMLVSGSADTIALVAGIRGLASNRGDVAVWQVPTGSLAGKMKPDLKHCNSVFFSSDGKSIIVAGGNPYPTMRSGGVYVFDATTFKEQDQPISLTYTVETADRIFGSERFVWAAATDSFDRVSPDKLKKQFKISGY